LLTNLPSVSIPSKILLILHRNKIRSRRRIVRGIRLHRDPPLQGTILHHPTTRNLVVPLQRIRPVQHGEIRYADLIGITIDDGGHAEVVCRNGGVADLKLIVAAVVKLRVLEFTVGGYEGLGEGIGSGEGDVLAVALDWWLVNMVIISCEEDAS